MTHDRNDPAPPDRRAIDSPTSMFVIVGADGRVTYYTPWAGRLLGGPDADLVGERLPTLFTPDTRDRVDEYLRRLAETNTFQSASTQATLESDDGDMRWIEIDGVNLLSVPGNEGIILHLADMTEHRRELEQVRDALTKDPLTGLKNRRALDERLQAIEPLTVMVIDLDRFKLVNENRGHAIGDAILKTVARRLEAGLPAGGCAYRVGGDEFAVVMPYTDLARVRTLAAQLLESIRAPSGAGPVTASLGVARSAADEPPTDVLVRADVAVYEVKQQGGGAFAIARDAREDAA